MNICNWMIYGKKPATIPMRCTWDHHGCYT